MKLAMDTTGNKIEANANAPRKAVCPHCKSVVVLRTRQRENARGRVTYFWRHENNSHSECPGRFRYSMAG